MKPAAIDHSATRCRDRRLLTNARIEWIAAIRYAAKTATNRDLIGERRKRNFRRREDLTQRRKGRRKEDSGRPLLPLRLCVRATQRYPYAGHPSAGIKPSFASNKVQLSILGGLRCLHRVLPFRF